jgi:NAD(P)H-flavin reductase/hemoglobin-like flavoprotein
VSAARNDGPGAGRHGLAGPPAPPYDPAPPPPPGQGTDRDEPGWSLPDARDGRLDIGELRRNPVTGPNAFGLGEYGASGAQAAWRGRSGYGSYDPNNSLFDIADDRRDDASTGWSSEAYSPASGSRDRPPAAPRGRHARPDDDDGPWSSGYGSVSTVDDPADAITDSTPLAPWHTPAWTDAPPLDAPMPREAPLRMDPLSTPGLDALAAPAPFEPPAPREPADTWSPSGSWGAAALPDDTADMVAVVRASFAAIAPRADELTQLFYGLLFQIAPETRDLFPASMETQRTRLLRALIHFVQMVDRPDELAVFLRQLGRDHRKFGVVGGHYDKVGEALVGALKEISGPHWSAATEHAWLRAYGLLSQVMTEAADAEQGPAVWMARVVEHRRVSSDVAVIRVQTSQPVPYLAGQYVSVEIPQRPRMWRTLSPANAPGPDCVLEFHVHTVPGGWVSRAMVAHVNVGEVWRIGAPMGQMTLTPRSRADLLMVTGGTGLTPARALIEQIMLDGSGRKVTLFVGGRTWDSLYDVDTLRRMAQDHPWLTVVPVVEEDGGRHGAETGTLGQVVARYGAWADRQVVVSGSPAMVRSTVATMIEAGTPFTNIHYDPQHTD